LVIVDSTALPPTINIEVPNATVLYLPVAGPPGSGGDSSVLTVIAGQDLSGERVVRPQLDGTVIYATNADLEEATVPLWITLQAALMGDILTVQAVGPVTFSGWTWVDGPIFLDVNGSMTQIAPTALGGAAFIRQVASPQTATTLYWDPQRPYAL
jgi:hypothetical protein